MKLHTDFFEKLHEKFPTMKEDAVIEGFYKFLKDITIESNIDYPREIDISTVTGTSIKFTDTKGNTIGIIEPVKKENFNHGIQLRVDDQVLGLFISDEYIATAIAPTPVPMQQGGNPKSIVTLDSFKQLAIYTLEELGLSFTEDGFIETDKGDDSLSSVGFVKQQLDALKQEILDMIRTNEEISRLSALPRGSIIIWTSKDIPNGWAICDGTNGTPDLRDRFIVGASNNRDINVIGGNSTTAISLEGLDHYHGVGRNPNLRTDGGQGWWWQFSTNGLNDIPVSLMPSSYANTKYYFKCQNNDQFHDHNWLGYVDTNNRMYNFDGGPVDSFYQANPDTYNIANIITSGAFSGTMDGVTHWSNGGASTKELSVKAEPPFYSVYYIMKIGVEIPPPTPETPEPPTPEPPDYTTPVGVVEGILTPYTLKVRFTDIWYRNPGRFSVYNSRTDTWKAATKIVDDVVYFIFTEEEINHNDKWGEWRFAKHLPIPIQELNWENDTHETDSRALKFYDTIIDDVVNIEDSTYISAYVNVGSAYI